MCGLLFSNIECDEPNFLEALSKIVHRGPDSPMNYQNLGDCRMGHNRLAILDQTDHGLQPFYSDNKRHVMIYNGEVYNYLELAKTHNISLKTHCDTELVLKLYLKLGEKFLQHLNGMFALVIYDTESKNIFCARDRLGIKPFYYYEQNGKFIFSSEIAPILHLTKQRKLDDFAIRQYKKMRTFFNGRTTFSHIKSLQAGHYMNNGNTERYWELPLAEKEAPKPEEVVELLDSAVKYRMISDVPFGSYLSGGLDSSIIAKIMGKYATGTFHTWTVGFTDNNEFEWGAKVAEHIGSKHHEILIEPHEFNEILVHMIRMRQEPLSVPNEVLIYKMTKEAKKYNTVLLSGEGADELFFGYDRIFSWAHTKKWNLEEFTKLYAYGSEEDAEVVEDAIAPFLSQYERNIDIVGAFFQISHLQGLLRRLDSSTMLTEVEARVPFVDHRLIERMAGVAFDKRTSLDSPKKLLKDAYSNALPHEVIHRKKVGFPVELDKIMPKNIPGSNGYDKWLHLNLEILQGIIG